MKKILLGMAAVSALAVGAPAAAQQYPGSYQNNGYQNNGYQNNGYQNGYNANGSLSARIGQLQTRLQAGVQSGAITRQEAMPIRQQLRQLMQLERQYSANGLTGQERSDLQQRMRYLRQQLRAADGGANGRYDQWSQWDREDGYGQNGRTGQYDRVDRNNDGYDDRDYDRDGRWDDDNGGYQQQPAQRGGLGGIIDSVLGTGGLRVGQRVSGNLGGVPYEYRDQFRDSNNAYFRSDGRQIYQIDARSQTVVRVYPMNR
jgi:hypothetical protein